MNEPVGLDVSDGIATLTLDSPERRNAIDLAMAAELVRLCEEIDGDPAVGAVLIRATGPAFCSGADRGLLARIAQDPTSDENFRDLAAIYEAFLRIGRLQAPTIALVQGPAVGAGLNLALSADARIVSPEARMISGFLGLGVHPGGGHYTLLSKLVGSQGAAMMGLFGQEVVGADCVARGLAWSVVERDGLEAAGRDAARVPAANPTLARRAARSHRAQAGAPWLASEAAVQAEQSVQLWSFASGQMASSPSGAVNDNQR